MSDALTPTNLEGNKQTNILRCSLHQGLDIPPRKILLIPVTGRVAKLSTLVELKKKILRFS